MKSTSNVQTTQAMNKSAIAPQWEAFIVEELSDEAQAAVSGGAKKTRSLPTAPSDYEYWLEPGYTPG
jgi:hypothetical protein